MADADANFPYFSHPDTVLDYARAAMRVGLWESEREVIGRYVSEWARVLELGCGAGRVAANLARAGWRDLTATDFAPAMVEAAAGVCESLGVSDRVRCEVADATALVYPAGSYDAVIFAFNGLQMIPHRDRREAAMREVARVLRPGGVFIFTGHDRGATRSAHWTKLADRLARGGALGPGEDDFGDSLYDTPQGRVYIHSADADDLAGMLAQAGLVPVFSEMRSALAEESRAVREFSDDTRFWVCVRR